VHLAPILRLPARLEFLGLDIGSNIWAITIATSPLKAPILV
jgi:hypothetical protein